MCHVVKLIPLQGLNWLKSPRFPLDMGNTCSLQSFSSNSTFIMIYLVHEMDIDYMVVDEMIQWKSRLLSVGFHTGARHRRRVAKGGLHL
jgi:hypothetical protein